MIYSILLLLLIVFYSDLKERKVYAFIFIMLIIFGGLQFYQKTTLSLYVFHIVTNISCLIFISTILWLYSKYKMKLPLTKALGIGDLLFFFFMAISFPMPIFLILFSFSLVFSLALFLILKSKLKDQTVPLAGFQALFLFILLFINLTFKLLNLYAV